MDVFDVILILTYLIEAAAYRWFNIGSPKAGNFSQLPRYLEAIMKKKA